MKKLLLLSALCATSYIGLSQNLPGLVGHWDMNGTTNDVTGNGMDGHGHNLIAAVGQDGVPGHAWSFDGATSYITIPYSNYLNVTNYSISARINVQGFYSGTCHGNCIFSRGTTGASGTDAYFLSMTDWPAGGGCSSTFLPNSESFMSLILGTGSQLIPTDITVFDQAQHIQTDQWMDVLSTFDDTTYRIYVNGNMVSSGVIPNPGAPMGTSMDSASIGICIYDAAGGYPYNFKGIIDDIALYNRTLTDCEAAKAHHSVTNLIVQDPANDTVAVLGTATYTIVDISGTATYQWQQNAGTGFVNLTDAGAYSGTATHTLTVNPVLASMSNYQYRCIRNGGECQDTSGFAKLVLQTTGINSISVQDQIVVSPNPAKSFVNIQSPVTISKVVLTDLLGQVIATQAANGKELNLDMSNLATGVYLLKINNAYTKKIVKE